MTGPVGGYAAEVQSRPYTAGPPWGAFLGYVPLAIAHKY